MAVEDYLSYTEVDTNSRLTVTADTVSFSGLRYDEEAYVYRDYGVAAFDGDFSHDFRLNINSATQASISLLAWSVANGLGGYWSYEDGIGVEVSMAGDALSFTLYITEVVSMVGPNYSTGISGLSPDTNYYCTVERDEGTGTYGTMTLSVYSDSARTVLVDSDTLALTTAKVDYRYAFAICDADGGGGSSANTFTGEVGDLDLGLVNAMSVLVPDIFPYFTASTIGLAQLDVTIPSIDVLFESPGVNGNLVIEIDDLDPVFTSGGSIVSTIPDISFEFTAVQGAVGALAVELPELSFLAKTGARSAVTMPDISVAFSGLTGSIGALALDIPALSTQFTATAENSASLAVSIPAISISFTAGGASVGSLITTLPRIDIVMTGHPGVTTTLDVTIPDVTPAFTAFHNLTASLAVDIPDIRTTFIGEQTDRFDDYVLQYTRPT